VAPPAAAPAPQPNRAGREVRRAVAAVVVDRVPEGEATVDRPLLRREMARVLEQEREMARILVAAGVGGTDILKEFIRLSIDEPVKVAGLLGAIRAPTQESQQLQEIQRQLLAIQGQLNLQIQPPQQQQQNEAQ